MILKINSFEIARIFKIKKIRVLINFFNFTISKINILQYQKLLHILRVQIISKK